LNATESTAATLHPLAISDSIANAPDSAASASRREDVTPVAAIESAMTASNKGLAAATAPSCMPSASSIDHATANASSKRADSLSWLRACSHVDGDPVMAMASIRLGRSKPASRSDEARASAHTARTSAAVIVAVPAIASARSTGMGGADAPAAASG